MKYINLINACHTEQELVELAVLFAQAAMGIVTFKLNNPTEVDVNIIEEYRDIVHAIEAKYLAAYGRTLHIPKLG